MYIAAHPHSKAAATGAAPFRHLWLELTRKCNLQCIHCYANSGPDLPMTDGMTTHDWASLLHSSRAEGCSSVQFIGGEPLIYPDLPLLLQEASSLNFEEIEVFTNGTRITPEWAALFAKLNVKVALSFYSPIRERHEQITTVPGSFGRTVRGIDLAVEAGLQTRVGIIQISQTDDEVEEARSFLTSRGVSEIRVDRVRGIGRADQTISFSMPEQQLGELCGACSDGRLCVTSTGDSVPGIMARAWQLGDARGGIDKILYGEHLADFRAKQRSHANAIAASCSPDNCGPYCNPNCSPFESCNPKANCGPNCSPPCGPLCMP